ncbi:MAG: carbamoyltransferase C-terminal domain-containing protein [Candidatus Omnitrophota bacterium]
MKQVILGINCGHDATAVLLKDGHVAAAVAEERLTKNKLQIGFPWMAIRQVLRLGSIESHEIDLVVLAHEQYLKANPFFINLIMDNQRELVDIGNELSCLSLAKEVFYQLRHKKRVSLNAAKTDDGGYARAAFANSLASLGITAPLVTEDHHMAHAASAYYTSGFDKCLVVTIDGSGDGLSHTTCLGADGALKRLSVTPLCYSPGVFYSAVTKFLGFKRHRHEGKITGLAAYGDPMKLYPVMSKVLCVSPDAKSFSSQMSYDFSKWMKMRWGMRLCSGTYFRSQETNHLLDIFRKEFRAEKPEDVAAAAQYCLEEAVLKVISEGLRLTGCTRVALAGGVFGNVKLNQRILELSGVQEVFIHPNMGDGGTALGGAYLAWAKELAKAQRKLMPKRMHDVYLGADYSDDEILKAIQKRGIAAEYCKDIESAVAEFLSKGLIVGRFNGRMEYGPRALGNRSILAQATDPTIMDWLNVRLNRTEFMPFAPSILAEDASRFYEKVADAAYPCEFMTITCCVKKDVVDLAQGAHHIDYTARPHIVKKDVNVSYYRILENYKKMTGLPLILNTSFNAHEHPIVESPEDAIESFLSGTVDVLAIGNFLLERSK